MRKKIFTWHIHGSYLFFLAQGDYDIYIPVNKERNEGYYGRGATFPFGDNVIEIEAEEVREQDFDVILFQTDHNYLKDQYEILSEAQRRLPRIFLKHDPPWEHPTNARLVVDDPDVSIVHVTHFNKLMWDNQGLETHVISHGVTMPEVKWSGTEERGIVVINNLPARGRLLGLDIFNKVRREVPLDIVGMNTESLGGREVLHPQLPAHISRYRFFFNPIRYTSLGLAVCEAMMAGMPVVGLATTELAVVIENEKNGFIHTDVDYLIDKMKLLLKDYPTAARLSAASLETARRLFDISRFIKDWDALFHHVIQKNKAMADSI